ncbi:hypothetical protein CHS0354_015236 [Potamilus streckersoni]|uniref:C-type lectin domain-containing protein n=1 Tax=Potamilus streckersoni TaxID=2493646 RepID=A0AAE0RRA8_9BIVA|nr:hypothetical protein CHS0354_015236 [Potamilus streckersoni]
MGNHKAFLLFLAFFAITFSTGSYESLSCPNGFELHGRRCYIVLGVYASWPEAKEYCQIIGGKLAAIASDYEQTIISGIMLKMHGKIVEENYWLDGSDMLVEKEWRWMGTDGASVPISFSVWAPGQPDATKERCLEIRYDWGAKWNNAHCFYTRSVICEARATGYSRDLIHDILQEP